MKFDGNALQLQVNMPRLN